MIKIMNDHEKEYGNIIYVKVNGKPYKTYIDKNGVQRFVPNKIIQNYVRKNSDLWGKDMRNDKIYTHNSIGSDVQLGLVSFEDYLEFQTMHNSSVEYVDSTVTQMLEELFSQTDSYKAFENAVSEKFTDDDYDNYGGYIDEAPGYAELYSEHFDKFVEKYYHMDNPLWE